MLLFRSVHCMLKCDKVRGVWRKRWESVADECGGGVEKCVGVWGR